MFALQGTLENTQSNLIVQMRKSEGEQLACPRSYTDLLVKFGLLISQLFSSLNHKEVTSQNEERA